MKDRGKHMIGPPMTLGETVYQLVQEGKTKTEDFEKLITVFGRKHLLSLYEAEKKKKEAENDGKLVQSGSPDRGLKA